MVPTTVQVSVDEPDFHNCLLFFIILISCLLQQQQGGGGGLRPKPFRERYLWATFKSEYNKIRSSGPNVAFRYVVFHKKKKKQFFDGEIRRETRCEFFLVIFDDFEMRF